MSSLRTSMSSRTMTSSPLYRDVQFSRLPSTFAAFLVVGIAIAVGAIYGDGVRNALLLLGFIALAAVALRTRLVVRVDVDALSVGPAHIEWQWIERVEVLEGAAMRAALTTGGHPNDYVQVRGTSAGLRAWLNDPSDPHPRWLASVRHPEQLRASLRATAVRTDAA